MSKCLSQNIQLTKLNTSRWRILCTEWFCIEWKAGSLFNRLIDSDMNEIKEHSIRVNKTFEWNSCILSSTNQQNLYWFRRHEITGIVIASKEKYFDQDCLKRVKHAEMFVSNREIHSLCLT